MTTDQLNRDIDEIIPGVIADRRHLHQFPELGFQEFKTAAYVVDRLRSLGVEDIQSGIAVTGVTGLIHGRKPGNGRVVLLRADMDALPIHEETGVDYASQETGKMHACGHDAHTSMLLAIARLLIDRRDAFSGTVKLLFQPAEEGPGGARPMIEAGVLDHPHVDAVFGMHVAQDAPLGSIELRPGAAMAASDRFTAVIQGKGGHGASPHLTIDAVTVAAHVLTTLQTIVSREINPIDPAVITVGAIRAGDAPNVIPDTAEMRGTVRTFNPATRQFLAERIPRLIEGVAGAMGATASVHYELRYPAAINDPGMTELVKQVASEVVGPDQVRVPDPQMGAEDFAYFLQERPGCFFFVGTRNEEKGLIWGHHHPRFDIDEDGMAIGIETMTRVVLRYLNGQ